ncbi:MAG: hypothetical protein EB161_08235 [Nitrosopumilaceae archaeon]|nr:hypothetical protein [Nitrosopumilaceae archaeon]NDF27615.1 hypothetical protein [Nitrosopumilaceae archaeon]
METNNIETQESQEPVINDPKAVLDALDRAKSDAKKFREEKEQLEIDLNSKDQKIAEFSGKLLHEKVVQKLSAEGLKEPKRFMKYIDTLKLDFDENFEVVGLDQQLEQLKQDFPEIFDAKVRVGGQADTAVKASVSTQYTASEMQAAKLLGKKI